jgi:uncharacterized membrane protein YfcA
MGTLEIVIAASVGFAVSIVSASVGGTALVIVPLLIAFGVEPRVAIATNKFAILFLSLAATLGFRRRVHLPPGRVMALLAVPVVLGTVAGALLVLRTPAGVTRIIIGTAAIAAGVFLFVRRGAGLTDRAGRMGRGETLKTMLILLPLSVYGGFFTGGYATLLTYALVLTLGFSFLQGVAGTRLLSISAAAAASIIFAWKGIIDYTVSVSLGAAYFAGATLGAHIAIEKGSRWLKGVFLAVVILLALRIFIMEAVRLIGD